MLQDRFDPRSNNFDLIRLIAALIVTFAHTYALNAKKSDPLSTLLTYEFSGTLAVWAFLVISGFLLGRSIEYQSTTKFVFSRFLRIYPAFFLTILLECLVIVPLFYEAPLEDYFKNWFFFHLQNLMLWPQNPFVPHVFSNLPHPVINGSLWTIPLEISFYICLIFVAGSFINQRIIYLAIFFCSLFGSMILRALDFTLASGQPMVLSGVSLYGFVVYSTYFWAGVCLWKFRDLVKISPGGLVTALIALYAARNSSGAPVVLALCLPYIVIYFATIGSIGTKLHNRIGDLSYGVYLFSYPITNVVVSITKAALPSWIVFLIATPIALGLAYASWHIVEKRCLALKALDLSAFFARLYGAKPRIESARLDSPSDSKKMEKLSLSTKP
ncbi:acyltransferase [Aquabacter sp. CN5-332]|uniref:acyltransferase family protein n=1 Tax=Aquabacter sp. CN5-332 TaxID=3156608 RepID=UPI0032B5EE8A